jgi:hypothetical protein
MNSIEKMLAEGATPESIYQDALEIVKRQNEARQAANKKIEEKRTAVIKALAEYSELLIGEKMPIETASEIEEALKELESIIKKSAGLRRSPAEQKKKSEKSDDERMIAFLKSIGALD